jgi:hypothetical protein
MPFRRRRQRSSIPARASQAFDVLARDEAWCGGGTFCTKGYVARTFTMSLVSRYENHATVLVSLRQTRPRKGTRLLHPVSANTVAGLW